MESKLCVNARFLTRRITGAQRYAVEIARQIKRIDGSVRFLAPPNIEHVDIAEDLEVEIVGRRKGIAWEQIDLPRHLKRTGHRLLLGMSFTAPLFSCFSPALAIGSAELFFIIVTQRTASSCALLSGSLPGQSSDFCLQLIASPVSSLEEAIFSPRLARFK